MKKLLLAVLLFMSFNKLNSASPDFYRKLIDSYECLIKIGGKTTAELEATRIHLLETVLHNFKTIDFNIKEIKELLDSRGYTEKQINDKIHNHTLTLSQLRNENEAKVFGELIGTGIKFAMLYKLISLIAKYYLQNNIIVYQTH